MSAKGVSVKERRERVPRAPSRARVSREGESEREENRGGERRRRREEKEKRFRFNSDIRKPAASAISRYNDEAATPPVPSSTPNRH